MTVAVLTLDEVRKKVRVGSDVLWVYRDSVEDGSVIIKTRDQLDLCWLEGYKSRNDTIDVSEVLAVVDKTGEPVEVFPFSIRGFLTQAGQRWIEAHPREVHGA